jgi:hypothetical protein
MPLKKIRIEEVLDDTTMKKWDNLVYKLGNGMIFHTTSWLNIIEETLGIKKHLFGIYKNNKLFDIFPFFMKKIGPLNFIWSPPVAQTLYGGCLRESSVFHVLKIINNYNPIYANIFFVPGLYAKSNERGYFEKEAHTCVIDLTLSLDELWKNLNKKCRNSVRKSQDNKVKIVEGDLDDLDKYYAILKNSKRMIMPIKFYRRVFETYPKNIKFLLAKYKNRIISGSIFILFKKRAYYWDNASLLKFLKYAPNNLVQWHFIEWASENKFKDYDMLGATIPGLERFKLSFGGKLVPYKCLYRGPFPLKFFINMH